MLRNIGAIENKIIVLLAADVKLVRFKVEPLGPSALLVDNYP